VKHILRKGAGAGQPATPGLSGKRPRQPAAVKGASPVKSGNAGGPPATEAEGPIKFVIPGGSPAVRSPDYQAWLERSLEHEVSAHYGLWQKRRERDNGAAEPQLTVPALTEALAARGDCHADFNGCAPKQRARDVFATLERMKGNGKLVSQGHPLRWYSPLKKSLECTEVPTSVQRGMTLARAGVDFPNVHQAAALRKARGEVFVIPVDEAGLLDADAPTILVKGSGPFIGPRGGKWADPAHTIPWTAHDVEPGSREHLRALGKHLEEHHGVKLDVFHHGDKVNLSRVVVPKDKRSGGTGSAVMDALHRFADAHGKTMTLTPSGDYGGSVPRLKKFYKRHGYVENKGRKKDYEISEGMYREPKGELKKGGGPFIGPRGGKWQDAAHTIPWKEAETADQHRQAFAEAEHPAHALDAALAWEKKHPKHMHGYFSNMMARKDPKKWRAAMEEARPALADPKHPEHEETVREFREWQDKHTETADATRQKAADAEAAEAKYEAQGVDPSGKKLSELRGKKVWLYHGTTSSLLSDIRSKGLQPAREHGKQSNVGATAMTAASPDHVFLTSEHSGPGSAQWYADHAATKHGGSPVIIRVLVDGDTLSYDPDDVDLKSGRTQYVVDGVSPEQIKEVGGEKLSKALYIGPRGGKWQDATHTIPWKEEAAHPTKSEAFGAWFKGSKIVDKEGKPLKVYHGTVKDFASFDTGAREDKFGRQARGAHFSVDPDYASSYAQAKGEKKGGNVIPAYLSIKHPYVIHDPKGDRYKEVVTITPESYAELRDQGYDGIVYHGDDEDPDFMEVVAFEPGQIKSAIGNVGTFDPKSDDITKALYIGPRGGRWGDPQHTIPYDEEKHGRKRHRKQLRKKPVTDNSQLDLDELRRDAKAADIDLGGYFPSGSNHLGEIQGFAEIGWNVGVTAPELSPVEVYTLKQLAGHGNKVFVDSGAFSEVTVQKDGPPKVTSPISDDEWAKRLDLYHDLAQALGDQLYPVMPDQVGNQAVTLERLHRYQHEVKAIRELGANIMCAVQLGPQSMADFDAEVEKIVGGDYIRAIPMMKNAATPEQLAEFLDARPQVKRIHLLGLGPKGDVYPKVQAVLEGRDIQMTADSVFITSVVGRDGKDNAPRSLTAAQDRARAQAEDDVYDVVFDMDYTDHIGQVNDWISKPRREGMAAEMQKLGFIDEAGAKQFISNPDRWLQATDEDGAPNYDSPWVSELLDAEWHFATIGELRPTAKGGLKLHGGRFTTTGRKREGIKEWVASGGKLEISKALYIGPKGGRWADAAHTIPYREEVHGRKRHRKQLRKKPERPAPEPALGLFDTIVEKDPALTDAQKMKPKSDGLLAAQKRDPGDPAEWKLPAGARLNEPLNLKAPKPTDKWSHPDYGSGTGRAPWQQEGDEDWAPKLESYDWIIINTSAGKDSQAMMTRAIEVADSQGFPREKIIAVHADLGRVEWEGTKDLARKQAEHYGLRFEVVQRQQNDLIEQIEERYGDLSQKDVDTVALHEAGVKTWRQLHDMKPSDVEKIIGSGKGSSKWEGARRASELVRRAKHKRNAVAKKHEKAMAKLQGSIDTWTKKGAGAKSDKARVNAKARVDDAREKLAALEAKGDPWDWAVDWGKNIAWPDMTSRFCTSDHKRVEVDRLITQLNKDIKAKHGRAGKVLNAMGIRAQESSGRLAMENFGRTLENSNQIVDDWFPIHRWREEKVWKKIEESGVAHHKAYDLGMRRLSCVFCVFASREDTMVAAKYNPNLFETYLELEEKVGADFSTNMKLADVADEIKQRREAGYELSDTAEWVKKALDLGHLDDDLVKAELQGADPKIAIVRLILQAADARLRGRGMLPTTVAWEWKGQGACLHLDDDKDSQHVEFLPYPLAYNASLAAAAYAREHGLIFEEHAAPPPPKRVAERLAKGFYILERREQ